jgi:hypothetical protein
VNGSVYKLAKKAFSPINEVVIIEESPWRMVMFGKRPDRKEEL